jgi:hypothetical protein
MFVMNVYESYSHYQFAVCSCINTFFLWAYSLAALVIGLIRKGGRENDQQQTGSF